MRKMCLLIVGLLVVSLVSSGFGFWVRRADNVIVSASDITQGGNQTIFYGAQDDTNFGVWVEFPQIDLGVSPQIGTMGRSQHSTTPEADKNGQPSTQNPQTQIQQQTFSQFSDVSSDVEYEARLFKVPTYSLGSITPVSKTYLGNVIKISGHYEYYPDEDKSYGFRFYNEHVSGLDYVNTFDASGVYKRYWGNQEAGCTFNVNFVSGINGGLIFGPTLHYLYKHYFGAAKLSGGVFGSYAYCTMEKFSPLDRNFLTYGIIGGYSTPIGSRLAGSAEVYVSHEYFVGGLQVPYYLSPSIQLVCGFKKAFVFKDWNLSNYIFTVGASRRF